jgi:hypothetical protein
MKRLRISIGVSLCLVVVLCLFIGAQDAFSAEYRFESSDKSISVAYKVIDGYKITISISTRLKQEAFKWKFEADYGTPEVNIIDLNGDNNEDIVIKLTSEGQYDPVILINIDNKKFVKALPEFKSIFFNYDVYNESLYSSDRKTGKEEYYLKGADSHEKRVLVFDNLVIDGKLYRNVVFKFNASGDKLLLAN